MGKMNIIHSAIKTVKRRKGIDIGAYVLNFG
jgi:hypothetical protein